MKKFLTLLLVLSLVLLAGCGGGGTTGGAATEADGGMATTDGDAATENGGVSSATDLSDRIAMTDGVCIMIRDDGSVEVVNDFKLPDGIKEQLETWKDIRKVVLPRNMVGSHVIGITKNDTLGATEGTSWLESFRTENIADAISTFPNTYAVLKDGSAQVSSDDAELVDLIAGLKDVSKIVAFKEITIAIHNDGSLTVSSQNDKLDFSGKTNVADIAFANERAAGVLTKDGKISIVYDDESPSYEKLLKLEELTGVVQIVGATDFLFALKDDGTVTYQGTVPMQDKDIEAVNALEGIQAIFASSNALVALKEDGSIAHATFGFVSDQTKALLDKLDTIQNIHNLKAE